MVALILTICVIATAFVLTIKEIKRSRGKLLNNSNGLVFDHDHSNEEEECAGEEQKEVTPYYERYIRKRNDGNNFLDYSGGIMGI